MNIPGTPTANVISSDDLKALLYITLRGNVELPMQKTETPNTQTISPAPSLLDKEA